MCVSEEREGDGAQSQYVRICVSGCGQFDGAVWRNGERRKTSRERIFGKRETRERNLIVVLLDEEVKGNVLS